MKWSAMAAGACLLAGALASDHAGMAYAGVVNPNISVIGQPRVVYTDDPASADDGHPRLDAGETELVFDAYLNPYATGYVVMAFAEDEVGVEEGYFSLLRGLPAGLSLRAGKYRVPFGKLNPVHPHLHPFAERFHVLGEYLPGDEALNETGVSLSGRLPAPGEIALTWTADLLQGDSFRIERASSLAGNDPLELGGDDDAGASRPAAFGRLSAFVPAGDRSGIELGISAVRGTGNVAARARTTVLGADVKAKLWNSERSYLVLQGELLALDRDDAAWDQGAASYTRATSEGAGGYVFAQYAASRRADFGASYERYQRPGGSKPTDQAFGLFAGWALLEESTVFRLGWERFSPTGGDDVNTVTLRAIFSMGPHKAHQF